jgi:hypothetical protein
LNRKRKQCTDDLDRTCPVQEKIGIEDIIYSYS